jgi:hypothetical protein
MRRVEFSAPYVKRVDPNEEDLFPNKRTIGRVFMTDGIEGALYSRGKVGAGTYFVRCLPWYQRAPYIHAWEGPNEPAMIKTPAERRAFDEFSVEWVRFMHSISRKTVAGNFSDRNPPDGTICEFAAMLDAGDYLGLHCYGAPTMRDNADGLALRYRRLIAELKAAGVKVPPVLIGECGIDLGIVGQGRKGWQRAPHADWGRYRDELVWYDGELCKDPEVVGAFVYTAGATGDWRTFDINEKQAADLARALAAQQPVTPEPTPTVTLPEHEQGDRRALLRKAVWWSEEISRRIERGAYSEAYALGRSLTKLLQRIEGMA